MSFLMLRVNVNTYIVAMTYLREQRIFFSNAGKHTYICVVTGESKLVSLKLSSKEFILQMKIYTAD